MPAMLGVRWEHPDQNARCLTARSENLLDYLEVNYPYPYDSKPETLNIPILAHTSSNPMCSVYGVDPAVAKMVRDGANEADSPWVGEHLTWLGTEPTGSLGYQINPLFTDDVRDVTIKNVGKMREFYGRQIALELSPIYIDSPTYESEMHFLGDVAEGADALIILDVTHWQIANLNLGRSADYGLDALDPERIVELHVAGMRLGSDDCWHDAHHLVPSEQIFEFVDRLAGELPALKAVTLEHQADAPETDFIRCLQRLSGIIGRNEGAHFDSAVR